MILMHQYIPNIIYLVFKKLLDLFIFTADYRYQSILSSRHPY